MFVGGRGIFVGRNLYKYVSCVTRLFSASGVSEFLSEVVLANSNTFRPIIIRFYLLIAEITGRVILWLARSIVYAPAFEVE